MNELKKYHCPACQWQGFENELDYDQVETCFGNDEVEICPKCGSVEVKRVWDDLGDEKA